MLLGKVTMATLAERELAAPKTCHWVRTGNAHLSSEVLKTVFCIS